MVWTINYSKTALKSLKKIDKGNKERILSFLYDRLSHLVDPRSLGKPLVGDLEGLWRYRVGNYRIICTIDEDELIILATYIGHRGEVYKHLKKH